MKSTVAVFMTLVTTSVAFAPSFVPVRHVSTRRFVAFADPAIGESADDEPIDDLISGSGAAMLLDMADLDDELEIDLSSFGPPRPFVNQQALIAATEKWRRHENDVGSPEYQIAVAHERIKYLTAHLQTNPKDYASRRGLVAIVNKRRRMLNYLFRESPEQCMKMVTELGVRFKPPGSVMSRADKYATFPKAKPKKGAKK